MTTPNNRKIDPRLQIDMQEQPAPLVWVRTEFGKHYSDHLCVATIEWLSTQSWVISLGATREYGQ